MPKLFESATKIVLLLFTLAAVVGLFVGVVDLDTFKTGLLMVLSFYFGNKQQNATPAV